jgi:phospholipase C
MANQLPAIKHVVQLMLENRSFDQMLGFLYSANGNKSPTNQPYDGLTGNESNPDDTGREIKVYKIDGTAPHPYLMPGADPGEGFYNTNYQLFSTDDPAPGAVPTNRGFVVNFKAAIQSDQTKGFGHVRARDAADHVGTGAGICGLRSVVFIRADPDHT